MRSSPRSASPPRTRQRSRVREANEAVKGARLAAGELGLDRYNLRPLLEKLGVVYRDATES
ncbi:hypothetical protein O7635_25390 [Asanoa sp. WMMD1127]|uniref:hypothetical protein n=1 Tax=Asanoa sp. WMMD1127 TaxID=3016107 RepID=UPI002417B687|nr:hypothetical protein [Asanoa sp. WMMD1127]MDG4825194.1 hypothetical protein [Asanoa sp. WMMD1127]